MTRNGKAAERAGEPEDLPKKHRVLLRLLRSGLDDPEGWDRDAE
jgi:hypothetical protein